MINSKINDIFYNKAEFGKDKKSITVEFIFQDSLRTLIDNQVNVEMEKITNLLMSKYKAIIRT